MTNRDSLIHMTGTTYEHIMKFLFEYGISYALVKEPKRRAGYHMTAEIMLKGTADSRTLDALSKLVGSPTRSAPSDGFGHHYYQATVMPIDGEQGTSKLDSNGNLRERVLVHAPVQSHQIHMKELFQRVKRARRIIGGRG